MKRLLPSLLLLIITANALFAQQQLSKSRTSGYYTYIYKLTDKEAFNLASKPQSFINDSFLHTVADSFYNDNKKGYKKELPYGIYLHVNVIKNRFNYRLIPVFNVKLVVINNRKDFQFSITDLNGKICSDAVVKIGKSKRVHFDQKANVYVAAPQSKTTVITVTHNGISNYFKVEPEYFYRKQAKVKTIHKKTLGYRGYMVFNKPKFKPLDTVRFKAYLVTQKGKVLQNKSLRLELSSYDEKEIIIDTIKPYHEGGYEGSFVLADSLNLHLDQLYNVILKEKVKGKWVEVYLSSIRYEDYELKSTNFSVRSDKTEHNPGNPITVYLKATDENQLAVPDGRVEVTIISSYSSSSKFNVDHVFIKDTLWRTNLILDPVGETKLVLPDSIFPRTDISFIAKFNFLNSNNEKKNVNKHFRYTDQEKVVTASLKTDSIHFDYFVNGKSEKIKAKLYTFYGDSEHIDSTDIDLPADLKTDQSAINYQVKTDYGQQYDISINDLPQPGLSVNVLHTRDSLRVNVKNEFKLPFWYTIFSDNKVFLKGYTNSLDTIMKFKESRAAHVTINYIWGGRAFSQSASAWYNEQEVNVALVAPKIVYPGQTVKMEVKVTDQENLPVPQTDVTAFAHTSKFLNVPDVFFPAFGNLYVQRKINPEANAYPLSAVGEMKLNWEKWGKELGLDTISYYQFTHTKELFTSIEAARDTFAVVAPFVINNGEIEPVHVVYIDEVPVYYSRGAQLKRYAFRITAGHHRLRLRTSGHIVTYEGDFFKGKKTILGIAADLRNTKAKVKVAPGPLTSDELLILEKYIIYVNDNFEGDKTTLSTENTELLLNPPPTVKRRGSLLIGPIAENQLRFKSGPLDQVFFREPGYVYSFFTGATRQKSLNPDAKLNRILISAEESTDYKQHPLKKGEIDSIWNDYLDLRSRTTRLFKNSELLGASKGALQIELDTTISKSLPYLKNLIIYKNDDPGFLQIYPGREVYFRSFDSGSYRIMCLFKDNTYFIKEDVRVKANGLNHYLFKEVEIMPADSLSIQIDRKIKAIGGNNKRPISYLMENTPAIPAPSMHEFESSSKLEEVVVVGYDGNKKQLLQGKVAGLDIQSNAAPDINSPLNQHALIIVDGKPYNGDISSIDQNSIMEIEVLKDKTATDIYGAAGANGVIIIKTRGLKAYMDAGSEQAVQQQTMRTNFSDYAIWQPRLITNEEGKAAFQVKFPDDITSWATSVIAMNGHKQNGYYKTDIKSFKTLSANFVSPQFALSGDTINVIGKLMNYSNSEVAASRKFTYNGREVLSGNVKFKNALIDTIAIVAQKDNSGTDSLQFQYTMQQDNGYFDGELRKVPLLQVGVIETKGHFNALLKDTSITYTFNPEWGKVTLRAEASIFPALLDEMEKLRRYEYLCNEQLASKLKALLLEKTVRAYLSEDFKEEKNIKVLIKKLQNTKRPESAWGWWENSNEEDWISLQVVEALLQAQKQGYAVVLDKDKLYNYLIEKLADRKNIDQIHAVKLLYLLNDKYYIKDWVSSIDKQKEAADEQTLYNKLQIMQLKLKAGMPADINWLLSQKKKTMFGNSYWGEQNNRFWDNSIQNTLLAYQILKLKGGYNDELERIQHYFLEQRKDGQWRNTYESSLILETILPELMAVNKKPGPATIALNKNETVTVFPYTKVIAPDHLTIDKKGNSPVYLTAYQQFNNPEPEKVSRDFSVKTWFDQNGTTVQKLKAGTSVTLKVEVEVRADADYVMVEIPIPAGCSYENKIQSFWGVETHREYFKNKTSIFCTKLKQGKHSFSIELMPRYSGSYTLNPAKADMMYFPVFYGREGMKRVEIKP